MDMKEISRTVFECEKSPLPNGFIAQVPALFDNGGTLIHNARNQIRVFDVEGSSVNIKKYCIAPIVNRWLYSAGWRTPKAVSTYRNALKILENGFLTPKPYGYILEYTRGILGFSYFISEQIQDMHPMGYGSHPEDLIKAVAQLTADMHQKGLLHIDFTPNNILFAQKNGKYIFSLVDINRFRFYNHPVPLGAALTNLTKPFHDDEQLIKFVKEYTALRGLDSALYKEVLRRRHMRNTYDNLKKKLKKLPFASWFINKPLGK